MPQARTAATSTSKPAAKPAASKPATAKAVPAKPATAKTAVAKPAAAKAAAAKPAAAKATAAKRASAAKPAATKTSAKPTTAKATTAKPAAAKSTAAKSSSAKPRAAKSTTGAKASAAEASKPRIPIDNKQLEAAAERLRKLNEKIIEVGLEAGKSALASYEKTLKSISTGGHAKDELEWIAHLASAQAEYVRDITETLAKTARDRLK